MTAVIAVLSLWGVVLQGFVTRLVIVLNATLFTNEVVQYDQPWDEEFIETSDRVQGVINSATDFVDAMGRLGSAISRFWDDTVAWFTSDDEES